MEEILNTIQVAVELLKEGKSLKVGDIRMGMENVNTIYITGWTQYLDLNNLSQSVALKELEEIKILFMKMVAISDNLRDFIANKKLNFILADNYGMGGIGICSEKDGVITWETKLRI